MAMASAAYDVGPVTPIVFVVNDDISSRKSLYALSRCAA
jgi:hypothetical protein